VDEVKVDLTQEAVNCLRFWQDHDMYGGSPSDVIVQLMEEWLNRDMWKASSEKIRQELERIKKGD
jgi:hypothetical protein